MMEAISYIRKIKCVSPKDSVTDLKLDVQQVIRLMDGFVRVESKPFNECLRLLRDLADFQNGPPLVNVTEVHDRTMAEIWKFLEKHENLQTQKKDR